MRRVLLALALWSTPALAQEIPAALYAAGHYAQAEAAGEAQGDAKGAALSARASLAAEMLRATPCLDCLQKAEAQARRAIALDPALPEGHIYLAAALGYEARIEGLVRARLLDYPGQAKANLDVALAHDPKNCWALAALGAWNIEIVHSGGETLGRWSYGAALTDGMADFAKAFASAPENLVLRYQFALVLGGFGAERYRKEMLDALARAVSLKPLTAYESFAQDRARELLAALHANKDKLFAKLVRRDQGYP